MHKLFRCVGRFRLLLGCCVLGLMLTGCGGSDDDGEASIPQTEDLRQFRLLSGTSMSQTRAELARHVGSRFELLYDSTHVVDARLVELVPGLDDPDVDQFSLVFEVPGGPELAAGTYTWRHYELGPMQLYVESQPNPGGSPRYRAELAILLLPQGG